MTNGPTIVVTSDALAPAEVRRWRDVVAALYVDEAPAPAAHRAAFEALLRFTPVAALQIPHVLGPA